MDNLTHKFATEIGFSSIKIQKLMDKNIFPDEEFENEKKEKIYNEAKYYHKAQKGLLRISKYQFNDTAKVNRKCLSKHNIKISSVEHSYDYGLKNNNEELNEEELKNIQLGILNYIKKVCDKNNINYFLTAGTLLGAIRHKGFIPWDDDIDIGLLNEDYKRFIEVLKNEKNERYILLERKDDKSYFYPFVKIVDTATILIEDNYNPINNYGVYVDVFSYIGTPNNKLKRKLFFHQIKNTQRIIAYKSFHRITDRNIVKRLLKLFLKNVFKLVNMDAVLSYNEYLQNKYNSIKSDFVMNNWSLGNMKHALITKKSFDHFIEWEFENNKYRIPQDYDEILKTSYGDYMTLPPVEKRISNHKMKAYWRKNEK